MNNLNTMVFLSPITVDRNTPMSLSVEDVIEIHEILVDWFAQSEDPVLPPGVRDMKLLESAVSRPFQSAGQKDAYDDIFGKAAALFHSLINNHPFYNGNKRAALVSAQVLLAQDGQWLDHASDKEMFEFTRAAAGHELTERRDEEIAYIVEWLRSNSRKTIKGEHPLKYGELKHNLKRFGYEIDPPDGSYLQVYKDGKPVEKIIKQGIKGFRPYHTDYISGLRKRLNLTPEYGVDSGKFYGQKGMSNTASQFIELRVEVMRQLAKT
jgi:death-on-curing protein